MRAVALLLLLLGISLCAQQPKGQGFRVLSAASGAVTPSALIKGSVTIVGELSGIYYRARIDGDARVVSPVVTSGQYQFALPLKTGAHVVEVGLCYRDKGSHRCLWSNEVTYECWDGLRWCWTAPARERKRQA